MYTEIESRVEFDNFALLNNYYGYTMHKIIIY